MAAKVKLVFRINREDKQSYSYYSLNDLDTSQTGVELSANDYDAFKQLGCDVSGFVTIKQLFQRCTSEEAKKQIEKIRKQIQSGFNIGVVAYVKCSKKERLLDTNGEAYFGKTVIPTVGDMSVNIGENRDIIKKMRKDNAAGMFLPSFAAIVIIGLLLL